MSAPARGAVRALLEDLVSTHSPSGSEEAACRVLVEHLSDWGLPVWRDEVGNVLAEAGGDGPHLVLLGHIDTVPGELPVHWEDETLWGRGAVDAKGPLAAHAAALASLPSSGPRVTFVAAVGEEATSPGARHLCQALSPEALVIAEPTGLDAVGLGYKGCLKADLVSEAEPAHAGADVPTASERLLEAIARLTTWTENPARDPGFSHHTLRVLHLEHTRSGLIDVARARLDLRLPGEVPARGTLDACLPRGVQLSIDEALPAVRSQPTDPMASALRASLLARGHEPRQVVKTGSSDWNVVASHWRCPAAAYGPGDASLDHTPHERISLDEVIEAAAVLAGAVGGLEKRIERSARATRGT